MSWEYVRGGNVLVGMCYTHNYEQAIDDVFKNQICRILVLCFVF